MLQLYSNTLQQVLQEKEKEEEMPSVEERANTKKEEGE